MDTITSKQMKLMRLLALIILSAAVFALVYTEMSYAGEREPEEHIFSLNAGDVAALEPEFGQDIADADPQINDPNGEALSVKGVWQCDINWDWKEPACSKFFAGTWRYYICIELDDSATVTQSGGTFPKYDYFDDYFLVKVNGTEWETIIYQDDDTLEHFLAAGLPDPYRMIEAEDGGDLLFLDSPDFDIPKSYPGENIWPYSVANYVTGGTSPYTFSKTSGPEWVTVDPESGEVSGAPEEEGDNDPLVITVEDSMGATKSITVQVAETGHDVIDKVKAYGYEPSQFDELEVFFAVTDGFQAEFITDEGHWEKKNGDEWTEVSTGTFTAGTWRYVCPLRIEGEVGRLSVLAEDAEVKVNGAVWNTSDYVYDPETYQSQLTVTSPEYEFEQIDITDYEKFNIVVRGGIYTGEPVEAAVSVTYTYGDEDFPETRRLVKDTDYTLEFSNNTNAGIGTVVIKGIVDFKGTVTRQFTIFQKGISEAQVEILKQQFTGQAVEPVPDVTLDGVRLIAGTDFDVSYGNNYGIGTATCKVTGKGNYAGTVTAEFEIADMATEELIQQYEDRITELEGELQTAKEDLEAKEKELEALQIKYDTLVVKTSAVKSVKVTFKSRKATVSYKSLGKGYKYKVFYATKKKGKYKAANKTATSKTKVTTGKLKKGKTYYFKVRAYKVVNGKTVASKYSSIVKKKCK